jgi:hypothetical protein
VAPAAVSAAICNTQSSSVAVQAMDAPASKASSSPWASSRAAATVFGAGVEQTRLGAPGSSSNRALIPHRPSAASPR